MSPIAPCCGVGGDGDCGLSSHSTTGWCLAATGDPVIVVTTLPCPPGSPDVSITTTLIDPLTGDVVAVQPIRPCGNRDWEIIQLCDYDEDTGELIATFDQLFEWDENTQTLSVTNVLASDPDTPYTPTGLVRACQGDASTDVEVTPFCYSDFGTKHGYRAWLFVDGVYTTSLYFSETGVPLVAPTLVDCPPLATELTAAAILAELAIINSNVDGLEACCATGNSLLSAIDGNTDGIEGLLTTIISNVDGLEACCAATNALLTIINTNVDGIESALATANATLTSILGSVDGLEACCAASNALLTLIHGDVDGVEALLTSILGSVDELESCCAAGNVLLAAIDGHVDGIEGLIGSTNTILSTIDTHVDGLEACCAASNVLLAAIDGHVDGLEALVAITNSTLTTIDGHVDGLEACCAASNVILSAIDGHVDGIEGLLTTLNTNSHLEDSAHASGDAGFAVWGVRNDTNAARTNADGDYSPISVDSAGRVIEPSQKNEDAAAASGDTGTFMLGVRNDTGATTTSADGDYSQISTDAAGHIVPSNAKNEDAAHASGDSGSFILGVRNDANAVRTSADGDYSPISVDSAGRPKVNVDVEVATSFTNGQNTDVDTGSENLVVGSGSNPAKHGVIVKALPSNTGTIYVGLTGVTTTTGFPLEAGDHLVLPIDDANKIFVASSVNNQDVSWIAI